MPKLAILTLVLAVLLLAQTKYLDDGVVVNHEGKTKVMVDTGMAARYIEESEVMRESENVAIVGSCSFKTPNVK